MAGPKLRCWRLGRFLAGLLVVAVSCSSPRTRGETSPSASARAPLSATPAPPAVPPPPETTRSFQPLGVAFWNARHGLVTGQLRCRGCDRHKMGVVFATRDGGRSWHIVLEGGSFAGEVTTNGAGRALVQVGPRLLQASGGGRIWATLGLSNVRDLSFVTPYLGWGVRPGSLDGNLVTTLDGGRHWRSVEDPCGARPHIRGPTGWERTSVDYIRDVWFTSPDRGWVLCGGDGAMDRAPVAVFETADGGRTWAKWEASWDAQPGGLQFLSDGRGWRWPYDIGTILRSPNGGATWHDGGSFDNQGPENSVWFISADVGYAIGNRSLYGSIDAGRSWRIVTRAFTPWAPKGLLPFVTDLPIPVASPV